MVVLLVVYYTNRNCLSGFLQMEMVTLDPGNLLHFISTDHGQKCLTLLLLSLQLACHLKCFNVLVISWRTEIIRPEESVCGGEEAELRNELIINSLTSF